MDATDDMLAMIVKKDEHQKSAETQCVITRAVRLSPISETFVDFKTLAGSFHLVKTQDNLGDRQKPLLAD